MDEQQINKSLEQQFELLSKASDLAISQLDFQSLKPITEAMIQIKHELIQPDYEKIFSSMNQQDK